MAASGRYIRRSAATSVTIGTKLELGARIRKNHAPKNPSAGARRSAHKVPASSAAMTAAAGMICPALVAIGQP